MFLNYTFIIFIKFLQLRITIQFSLANTQKTHPNVWKETNSDWTK